MTIPDKPQSSASWLAKHLHVTEKTIKRDLAKLKNEGKIRRIGPAKGGRWDVVSIHG